MKHLSKEGLANEINHILSSDEQRIKRKSKYIPNNFRNGNVVKKCITCGIEFRTTKNSDFIRCIDCSKISDTKEW